jgi:Mn2+/Fe2+ NRAMP family transporter
LLVLTHALNAVLLLVLLPFLRRLGRDRELMGEHALGWAGRVATGLALAVIATSVVALAVLAVA